MQDAHSGDAEIRREGLSSSSYAVLVLGLGCYIGWQTVGISPTLFPAPQPLSGQVFDVGKNLETLLFLGLLLLLGLRTRRGKRLLDCKPLVVAAPLLMFAATACTYLCGWVFDSPAGTVLSVGLEGSKALLFLCWAECLGRVRFRNILLCVSLSYAVTFALCLLVTVLQPGAALLVHALMPLASGAALAVLMKDRGFASAAPAAVVPEGAKTRKLPVKLLVGIGLFGAIVSIINVLSENKSSSAELYTLYAGIVTSTVTALIAARRMEKFDFAMLYRLTTPLIIASAIIVLVLESGHQQYEAFAIGVGWSFFRIFSWTLWCSIALRSHLSFAYVFAMGQTVLSAFATLTHLFCTGVLPRIDAPLTVMVAVVLLVAILNSVFIMSESNVLRFFRSRDAARRIAEAGELTPGECVRKAAEEFGLSKREEEIALLVMENKNNAVIQNQLCITESTLRTHLRNIYGKTSVHSRQELIDLLRSYADED